MTLRYEDLMREPMKYAEPILQHMGLNPSKSYFKVLEDAHTSSIGKHEDRRSTVIDEAERIARDELLLYGYSVNLNGCRRPKDVPAWLR